MELASYDNMFTVGWGDCDAAGRTYFARYFEWFTNGYMGLLDHYGLPYIDTFHRNNIFLVCLKTNCEYKKMVTPLERLTLKTALTLATRTRMEFRYRLVNTNGDIVAFGNTSHAYVDQHGKPMNLEKQFPRLWQQLTKAFHNNND